MRKTINIFITLIIGFIYYYLFLPAINIHNTSFYVFISILIIIYSFLTAISSLKSLFTRKVKHVSLNKAPIPVIIILAIIILNLAWNFIESPLFMSKKYANRITIDDTKDFKTDIPEVDFTKLPLLDKTSSQKLGDRVMGQMSDLVSQYDVSNIYTQINYNNKIVRVTPLEYASPIKWLTNRKDGVKGYIIVDSTTGESKLVRLDKGMKYVETGLFNDNVYRKLRFAYPTKNFGNLSFEIDNEGNPYWVMQVLKYHGVNLRAEVEGVIILDAITGKMIKYSVGDIPSWIDVAYNADLLIEQVDDWGTYQSGFFNSIFSQKNVMNTTDGYNYLAINDDIYMYTGITSIVNDESNLGFILSNMRTGETSFYSAPGAEEYSAMDSAEGAVQQMKYKSTFPLLINLEGRPTYLVSLKDAAGLVKMYGFIDVEDYQKVVVTDSSKGINEAAKNYLKNNPVTNNTSKGEEKEITIKTISSAVINSTTYYYIIDTEGLKYKASIELSDELPFKKSGDKLKITYQTKEDIININKID